LVYARKSLRPSEPLGRAITKNSEAQPISGADGVKTAVLRKGHTKLKFISAAAHRNDKPQDIE
jgi:hypothetical protein